MRLLWLWLLLLPFAQPGLADVGSIPASTASDVASGNRASANLPLVLQAWKSRVDRNHGVHPWTRQHDGMRVW
ncbi:MAG: hypothetical protein ABIW76_18670, partial [Fibrobacteria bacterium]